MSLTYIDINGKKYKTINSIQKIKEIAVNNECDIFHAINLFEVNKYHYEDNILLSEYIPSDLLESKIYLTDGYITINGINKLLNSILHNKVFYENKLFNKIDKHHWIIDNKYRITFDKVINLNNTYDAKIEVI